MTEEQKQIIAEIKTLVEKFENSFNKDKATTEKNKHDDKDWEGGTPMGELPG
jgi:hypothetical protein